MSRYSSSFDNDKQDCSNKISTSEQEMINEAAHDKKGTTRPSQKHTRNAAAAGCFAGAGHTGKLSNVSRIDYA